MEVTQTEWRSEESVVIMKARSKNLLFFSDRLQILCYLSPVLAIAGLRCELCNCTWIFTGQIYSCIHTNKSLPIFS
ncbi:hypothetical protein ILYODFUR_000443 [Ilyodon furcidens]|uniref:Uncharacterized protein n=1 Tax=Ilyodon furcidens TaxID=33524 RepID=A0ABV0V9X0_9TELE